MRRKSCGQAARAAETGQERAFRQQNPPHMESPTALSNADALFEDLGRRLYVESQIDIPPDVRTALREAADRESQPGARGMLRTMLRAMDVSDRKQTLVCQDTGIPIFWITIGRGIAIDGAAMLEALRRGVERATRETPLRSSIVSPIGRENKQTSSGDGVPVFHIDFSN